MESLKKRTFANVFARLRQTFFKVQDYLTGLLHLSDRNWKWISGASLLFIIAFTLWYVYFLREELSFLWMIVSAVVFIGIPLLVGILIKISLIILRKVPRKAGWLLYAAIVVFFFYFSTMLKGVLLLIFYLLFTPIFILGAVSNLSSTEWKSLPRPKKLLNFFFLTLGVFNLILVFYFLLFPGTPVDHIEDQSLKAPNAPVQLHLPDPADPGEYQYKTLFYGSGKDKHRNEFGSDVDIKSKPVDASAFVDGWDKLPGKLRSLYWGFGPDSLPLNGRVYLPEGKGFFPLILLLHGNHLDRDFSDGGYDYLGIHLATHGYMAVSVDENFLNSGLMNFNHGLQEENDARAWLLLKHLEQLDLWNNDPESVLFGKVNTREIILVGHSRGGEAVSIAACFNKLPYYPDNSDEKFNFNFGIKGIVSIAQVDGQYSPSNRNTPLSGISYLGIQGSLDADLASYSGLRQYNRVHLEDSSSLFKAGIYIQGANHGQFNSSWGQNDIGFPNGILLNRGNLLPAEKQERIALAYITAFAKTVYREEEAYRAFLTDYRSGREWLPNTLYINQYQPGQLLMLADFEEDLDLSTLTYNDARVGFSELSKVYESELYLAKGKTFSKSLILGWNNESDSVPGCYHIELEEPIQMDSEGLTKFQMDVAVMNGDPGSRKSNKPTNDLVENETTVPDVTDVEENDSRDKKKKKDSKEEEIENEALAFSIEFIDDEGNSALLSLADHFPLNEPIETELYKLAVFSDHPEPEIIPQHIEIDLSYFYEQNPAFQKNSLHSVKFIFDQGEKGLIAIDNIGFSEY